ncbi:hypothetical protein DH2020_042760 [Rehmannia glutinosa]|uniref:R2R3-MYB protein n=1 Tax=Rehmannia glutinosa TaxID=99300 RepID=A0ABR0UMH8_REHGL
MEYSETKCENYHNAPPPPFGLSNINSLKLEKQDDDFYMENILSSSKTYLQDFHHLDYHQFPLINPTIDIRSNGFDPFDPFDVYEFKPYDENSMNVSAMQGAGLFNFPNRKDLLTEIETALRIVVPDESSCVTADKIIRFHKEENEIKLSKYGNQKNNKFSNKSESLSTKKPVVAKNKSKSSKGQWTIEEDRILIHLVEKYGVRKWSRIAEMLKGRIGKQCRERWHNHLRPDIKKDLWTEDEDRILIEAHAEVGNKWAEIAKRLPGGLKIRSRTTGTRQRGDNFRDENAGLNGQGQVLFSKTISRA